MSPAVISITIVAYFIILFTISYIAGRKADNDGFFVGNRKSAWYVVAFSIFTKKQVYDKYIPLVAIASPILCYILQRIGEAWLNGYQISYELLIINALFTFLGLCLFIKRQDKETSYTTHTTKQKVK